MFWTGPGVVLEILRLREYSGGKIVEILVVWKYICIVIVIAFKMAEGQTGVEIVDDVGTTNLE